jgi:hypothetical protein
VPDTRKDPNLKASGSLLGFTTVDISWALDAPWQELLEGHQADPSGYPLGTLIMVLFDKAADLGILLSPEFTLTDVLREVTAKDWRIFRKNIRFTKGAEKQDAEWDINVERRTINDSLLTIGLSVCCQWIWEGMSTREKSYVSIYLRLTHSGRLCQDCTAINRTWKGDVSSHTIFDVIYSDKDDIVKVIEVERILDEDAAAVLYSSQGLWDSPLEVSKNSQPAWVAG